MAETVTNPRTETVPAWQEVDTLDLKALESLELPGSDGEPMENERERLQITLTLNSLHQHWHDRTDFYAGGNMFIYYSFSQARAILEELEAPDRPKRVFRGPDVFIVLDVDGSYRRQRWVVWEEEGRYPDIIFEFLSPKTRHRDLGTKKHLYERTFQTREYFCFDYLHPSGEESLFGWRLDAQRHYQPIVPDPRGWLWSEELQLWVGRWTGSFERDTTTWMRFYTLEGELVLTRAEQATDLVEQAEQQTEQAEQRAEQAEQRAKQEAQRAERLAAQLQAMGIEPDV
jgi:Uma2 family endonuclease